jgi:GT2 family glycosyltransferase
MIYNTFITNPVRPDYIERNLDTLYRFTDGNFRVIVVDQTADGVYQQVKDAAHVYLRPHRNLGFSKSMNEGIIHALRWGSKFITVMNDDVEFMNHRWWDGVIETFDMDEKILAVNPECPRIPGWGYGLDHGQYLDLLPYKTEYTDEDYNFLLAGEFNDVRETFNPLFEAKGRQNTFPTHKVGVIDGIATWCTIFKRECLETFGLFEERYYPGGGEDYDYNARVYREKKRMVGTTKSWVWHWWGQSKDVLEDRGKSLPALDKLKWCNPHLLWPEDKNGGQEMDPWGHWTDKDGNKIPMYRDPEIGIIDI